MNFYKKNLIPTQSKPFVNMSAQESTADLASALSELNPLNGVSHWTPENDNPSDEDSFPEREGVLMKKMKEQSWRLDNSDWNAGNYLNHALLKTDVVSAEEACACFCWGVILTKKQNIMQDNLDDWEIIRNAIKTKMLENHPSVACMFEE